jgi:gluconolactonase
MRIIAHTALLCFIGGLMIGGCKSSGGGTSDQTANRSDAPKQNYPSIGTIERLDPRLDALLPRDARIQQLTDARFDWSEGPVWVSKGSYLLFSDVPKNVIHKWKEGDGVSDYMKPSGYTGASPRGGEPGSNGLTLDNQGRLVLCEHGDRRVTRVEANGKKTVLADSFEGKRLNSPNDCVFDSRGNLYFTDPPYGLEGNVNDPKKELPFQGVYRVSTDGRISLLTKEMTRPNGIALSPDEKTLYVANSDPQRPVWMAFDLDANAGTVSRPRVFFDAKALVDRKLKGLPDGLKVDRMGNLWATGPGGVLVIAPDGKHLGTLNTGQATANCGWGDDGSTLYITADMYLCRIHTRARGRLPG